MNSLFSDVKINASLTQKGALSFFIPAHTYPWTFTPLSIFYAHLILYISVAERHF